MPEPVRYQLWIATAASLIFFTNLGGAALWDMDEALYAACAREMLQRGDWILPVFNGRMFSEKPVLLFWIMMVGFKALGVTELGARFFSALFGVLTALASFHLGRLLFSARTGLWAGLITASTIIFTVSARAATVDAALTLLTTTAMLLFVWARKAARKSDQLQLRYAVPMYACLGMAVLAKGPVGVVLPLAAMGLYLLVSDGRSNFLRSIGTLRPFTAAAVVGIVALPWYLWVGLRTDWLWPRQFLGEYNLLPFGQPTLGHGDPDSWNVGSALKALISVLYCFYHPATLLIGFFPWSVFLGPTLIDTVQRIRRHDVWRDGCVLAWCWVAVWIGFWSLCRTKLPHYLLPAYPGLALLTGCFIERWQKSPASVGRWWLPNAWLWMMVAGTGMMTALPLIAAEVLPGEEILGLLGLIPLLGGAWCRRQTVRQRHQAAALGFAVAAAVLLTAIFGFASLRVDRHQNARPAIAAIHAAGGDTASLATYRFFRESLVFYGGHPVTRCDGNTVGQSATAELQAFLTGRKRSYVITTDAHHTELTANFPGQFQMLFHQRQFLGPGEILILAHPAERPPLVAPSPLAASPR